MRTKRFRSLIGRATVVLTAVLGLTTAAGAGASAAPALVPSTDRQVTFTQDGTTVYGTLHVPAHRAGARLAAALLLPGSGATDRNGNDLPLGVDPNTLQLIAGVLGDQGVMSFRFDKYFSGQTGGGAFAADPGDIDLTAFIRQADAAYHVLAAQPAADPRRLLVVGHSEGGFTSMLVAESVRPRPAGLALLEPQDARILDLVGIQLDEQIDAAVTAGQLSAGSGAANKAGIARVIAAFRAGRTPDYTGLLPAIAQALVGILSPANARYVRSDDAVYPPAVAARLAPGTRVLVTDGTSDTNVPLWTTPPLVAALRHAHTTGPGLTVLPGLDHFLHPAGAAVNTQSIAPSAIDALVAFTRPYRD